MSPLGTFQKTGRLPSDRARHLFHTGNLARSWRRLRIENMAYVLGMDEQAVVRQYGPFKLPPEPESIVYLVSHTTAPADGDPVKVGFTRSIRDRLEQLQPGSIQKLWLVRYLPGGKELEAELHSRLRHCQIREDWFEMCGDIRDEFDSRQEAAG